MSQIQWFPGHMLKTQKSIQTILPTIDLVIQVLESRAPFSTRNPLLHKIAGAKPTLYIINKRDLADKENLKDWMDYFSREPNTECITIALETNDSARKSAGAVKGKISEMMKAQIIKKGKVRVVITGVPNVGKSSLINALIGKKGANVAKKAGLTQSLQTYQFKEFSLIDTPGILWHKWDERTGYLLAILGSITDRILEFFMISEYAFTLLSTKNKGFAQSVLGQTSSEDFHEFISIFARKRGFLLRAGEIDTDKACFLFIKELREGKWGSLVLENPSDLEANSQN